MGKLILVSGANDSGKSLFAEGLAVRAGTVRRYIATMIPQTEENAARIRKHIAQREGLGFETWELACRVGDAPVSAGTVVLLEDVSNLLANCFFGRGESAARVLADILALQSRCGTLIAVTISGLAGEAYTGETKAYIAALNELNRALAARADTVIEMKNRTPCRIKGELYHDP